MAGIVAALEPHHHIGARGQPVDDLSFAFVAPLGADHCNIGHEFASYSLRLFTPTWSFGPPSPQGGGKGRDVITLPPLRGKVSAAARAACADGTGGQNAKARACFTPTRARICFRM